ncbi:MAG TPA: hypothetical protein VGB94_04475 [Acidobacteriaceae bacterium]
MKIAFVVGFFAPVSEALSDAFPRQSAAGTLILMDCHQGKTIDITAFKSGFFQALQKHNPAEVVVVLGIARGYEWVVDHVESIVGEARRQYSSAGIALDVTTNLCAPAQIAARIAAFDLPGSTPITCEQVQTLFGGQKAICIVAEGHATFKDALQRAGFPDQAIASYFDEEKIATGRNSTLMEHLQQYTRTYRHMLYAWDGLRTSGPKLVRAFKSGGGIFIEAPTASKIAENLRRRILQE